MCVKSFLAAAFCVSAVAAVGAGPAFAGEVNGNGDPTAAPTHAIRSVPFPGRMAEIRRPGGLPSMSKTGGRSPRQGATPSAPRAALLADACDRPHGPP